MPHAEDPEKQINLLSGQLQAIEEQERHLRDALRYASDTAQVLIQQTQDLKSQVSTLEDAIRHEKPPVLEALPTPVSSQAEPMVEAPLALKAAAPPPVSYKEDVVVSEKPSSSNWELTLGVKWFSRIGIVILLLGVGMALNYSFPLLTKELKILLGFVFSAVLFFTGRHVYQSSPVLGRILQGGGLSLGYGTLYALFFFPSVRLIENPFIAWATLAAYVILTMVLSLRMRSQTVAILALVFGYYTSCYAALQWIAFTSAFMLALASMVIVHNRPQWRALNLISLIGALISYIFWYDQYPSTLTDPSIVFQQRTFLWALFGLFHLAAWFPKQKANLALYCLNTFVFYTIYLLTQHRALPEGTVELIIATVHLITMTLLNSICIEAEPKRLSSTALILGLLFIGLATLQCFDGNTLSAVLAAEAVCVGCLSVLNNQPKTWRVFSYLFWGLAWCTSAPVWFDASPSVGTMLTTAWLYLSALVLEHWVYRRDGKWVRLLVLLCASIAFFFSLVTYVSDKWQTLFLALTAFVFLAGGFISHQRKYRWLGISWLALAGINLVVSDLAGLETPYKIALFLILGIGLLAASYAYSLLVQRNSVQESPFPQPEAFHETGD